MQQSSKLIVSTLAWRVMCENAARVYPEECCGFICGYQKGRSSIVVCALDAKNIAKTNRENTFQISAADYLFAENFAEQKQLSLLGVYHSHPNERALPSLTDALLALPNFSYIIIGITERELTEVRCWQLDEHACFKEKHTVIL